jgi:hypothetical protein
LISSHASVVSVVLFYQKKRQFLLMQMENEFLGAETLNSLKKLSDQRKSAALFVEAAV